MFSINLSSGSVGGRWLPPWCTQLWTAGHPTLGHGGAFLIRVFTTLTALNLSRSGGEARMWRRWDGGAPESAGEEACPYFTRWQPEFINSNGSFWVSDFSSWLSFRKETVNSHIATMGRALLSLVRYSLCLVRAFLWGKGTLLGRVTPRTACACASVCLSEGPCACAPLPFLGKPTSNAHKPSAGFMLEMLTSKTPSFQRTDGP